MKIAVIAPTEIPARRANTLQVMKMTQALALLGNEVRLAAPKKWPGAKEASPEHQNLVSETASDRTWNGLACHYGLHHEFPITWLPAVSWLRRYDFSFFAVAWARRWGAELIYTRLPQAAAGASRMRSKTVFEIHDLPQGRFGISAFRNFLAGRGAYRLVAITQALANDLSKAFGSPASPPFTIVAPDGVDLDRFTDLPAPSQARLALAQDKSTGLAQSLNPEQFTAGYTGHLYAGRGMPLLLDFAELLPDVTFLIVGGEPQDVERLRSEANVRRLQNILLTGFVPNAELPRYQAACDVLLMPYQHRVAASSGGDISRYLSPMKLFEYLACGRAIISSDLPVLQEVLNPRNAILLPCDDVDAWVQALRNLQNDSQFRERLAAQARQDSSSYTWEARAVKIFGETPAISGSGKG